MFLLATRRGSHQKTNVLLVEAVMVTACGALGNGTHTNTQLTDQPAFARDQMAQTLRLDPTPTQATSDAKGVPPSSFEERDLVGL